MSFVELIRGSVSFNRQSNRLLARLITIVCLSQFPAVTLAADLVDFARDIRPILSNHCWSCHGPDEHSRKAGLRLDHRAGAVAKLESGAQAVDPGNASKSELLTRIHATDENEVMPPPAFKKPLDDKQRELLKLWIAQGARYAEHWAFIPPVRPAIPAVKLTSWPRNALDRLVLKSLEDLQRQPNPEAGKATWLRRVTLDLTGVSPSIDELDTFIADQAPDAYERVVDRLLESPRYAERMALQWLDAARYADTNGYNNDEERTMWPWRDWVIKAFASNMPFDRFIVEQVAGDLLPNPTLSQRVATGFNRNHVLTTEGGIIEEEYRVEYVVDRVHTTATVFMGLSFQCARCHDHKYDPITQRDFYQFYAFFNNVSDKVVGYNQGGTAEPILLLPTADQLTEIARLQQSQKMLNEQLLAREKQVDSLVERWEQSLTPQQKQQNAPLSLVFSVPLDEASGDKADIRHSATATGSKAAAVPGSVQGKPLWKPGKLGGALEFDGNTFVDLGQVGEFDKTDKVSFGAWVFPVTNNPIAILSKMNEGQAFRGYDLLLEGGKPAVHIVSHWPDNGLKVIGKNAVPLNAWHHVLVTWDGAGKAVGVKIYVDGVLQELEISNDKLTDSIKTEQPFRIGRRTTSNGFSGLIDDVQFFQAELTADEVKRLADGQATATLADVFATPIKDRTAKQIEQLRRYYLDAVDQDYRRIKSELVDATQKQRQQEQAANKVMVMAELPQVRATRMLIRGQYDAPGDTVMAGVPSFLGKLPAGAPANRLGLAQWLTSPDHPLTARVAVNRWWGMFFGTGLVETAEDLGAQGTLPSHPELLDYLARELIDEGWNVKALLKQIVLSATYRQSSDITPQQLEHDPHNRLLSHGARFRMPAEMIRDNALAVSGLLQDRLGGPSVKPYQPEGLWEEVSVERRYKYVPDKANGLYRRSMYTFWKRTCPPPSMTSLDAPDRETCLIRRARTNTPLQALVLLNDPTYIEAARKLAERVIKQGGDQPEERLNALFRFALSRLPTAGERTLLLELLAESQRKFQTNPLAADQLLKVGDAPATKSVPPIDLAAWTTIASLVLNLDETLTKN
ncbi:MAG: Planctomycete cytochrome [Planctomycetaceae bacterium]|nr:Planctomycete cytochrome [Planctomycetaceae bacterium]